MSRKNWIDLGPWGLAVIHAIPERGSDDDRRNLTLSFRFGKETADLASVFVREAKGEKGFRIKGNPPTNRPGWRFTPHSRGPRPPRPSPRPRNASRSAIE